MSPSPTLSTAPPEHPAMDYARLREEGIRHLERMAGQLWTDFNTHDPGITILEQLCYAITDLSCRIDYEMPDLLAEGGGDPHRSLPGAAAILTSHPVTLTDLRKLVLDVEGVRNAWIEPAEECDVPLHYHAGAREIRLRTEVHETRPMRLKGLHRVRVEVSPRAQGTTVEQAVARRLHANRGLCEDFEIERLIPRPVRVEAQVEIQSAADPETILPQIYRRIGDYFSPSVPFQTLDEMLASGKRIDEVFDGPLLGHGFLDSEALANNQLRTAVRTSDLIREIMGVPGVRAVPHIVLGPEDDPCSWSLEMGGKQVPRFDPDLSRITLQRAGLPVGPARSKVVQASAPEQQASYRPKPDANERDRGPRRGRDRRVGHYHSIQHQFPDLYGVGEMGLPDSASARRKSQAKQLKAYLLFYDQLLADHFAQLAHLGDLFAFRDDVRHTYFAGMIDDPRLGLDDIHVRDPAAHRTWLQDLVAAAGDGERKNRFLDHLLARFAEQFGDCSSNLSDDVSGGQGSPAEKSAYDKQALLRGYPRISSARGTAFNYLEPWGGDNVSGLEERIRLKLGLEAAAEERFYLVEHILLRPLPEDAPPSGTEEEPQVPLLAQVDSDDPYSLQLSFVFPGWPPRLRESQTNPFRQLLEQTIRDETPAHLTPHVHWLSPKQWETFEEAYLDWQEKHRIYRARRLSM